RWIGSIAVSVTLAGIVALSVAVWRQRASTARGVLVAVAVLGIGAIAWVTLALRDELDGLIARGAARGQCFDAHAGRRPAAGFPVWEKLADAPAARIAVSAGFDGIGHEVFRYPLLGR